MVSNTAHNLQLVESTDAELWKLRPSWKDLLHLRAKATLTPILSKGQLYSLKDTLMNTEMIQRTSVILAKNPTTNLF